MKNSIRYRCVYGTHMVQYAGFDSYHFYAELHYIASAVRSERNNISDVHFHEIMNKASLVSFMTLPSNIVSRFRDVTIDRVWIGE
jgi:hypothetical protein